MWKAQPEPSSLLAFGMLFQPARSAVACASSERFCLSLLLLLALLGLLGCCLQGWLGRPRLRAAQRSLVVFAVGETESVHGSDGPPCTPPQRSPPPLQIPGWSAQEPSGNAPAWSGSQPPPYEEITKQRGSLDQRLRPDDCRL